jgi:hypothetical protein
MPNNDPFPLISFTVLIRYDSGLHSVIHIDQTHRGSVLTFSIPCHWFLIAAGDLVMNWIWGGGGEVVTFVLQSRQSARLSLLVKLKSSKITYSVVRIPPSPASECCPPPHLWFRSGGGNTLAYRRGGGEQIRTKGETLWYSICIV